MIRAQYPDGPLIHDRSFSSLSLVVKNIFRGGFFGALIAAAIGVLPVLVHVIMGITGGFWPSMLTSWWRWLFAITSIIFGGVLSYLFGLLCYQSDIKFHDDRQSHMKISLITGVATGGIVPFLTAYLFDPVGWIGCMLGITELLVMISTLGFGLGLLGFIGPVAGIVVSFLQWDLNIVPAWQKVRGLKAIIFHQQDGMIPYQTASLHKASGGGCNIYEHSFGDGSEDFLPILYDGGTEPVTHVDIELMEDEDKLINCHMCPLNTTTAWHYIVLLVRAFLDLPLDSQALPEIADLDDY